METLTRPDGETLAFRRVRGDGPTVLWIGGFRSDMEGTKALALDAAARERGWSFVRYDHFAHGRSSGAWEAATVGRWIEDAVALIDHLGGPVLAVGSSMGGWVALAAAEARPDQVAGMVLINPAPDFTSRLMWPALEDHVRRAILRDGRTEVEEEGYGRYVLTRRFFDEGRERAVLEADLAYSGPVHVLQGRADEVVPWTHQVALMERLTRARATLEIIPDGDHRLSTPEDLVRLVEAVEAMRKVQAV